MKSKETTLSQIGSDSGHRVPDTYFTDFNKKMSEMLPEHVVEKEPVITPWLRVRPWLYMAAMFAGIWLMMKGFTLFRSDAEKPSTAILAEALNNESLADDVMSYSDISEYDIMESICEDKDVEASGVMVDSVE